MTNPLSAELCRRMGWAAGDTLEARCGDGVMRHLVTAVGAELVLSIQIASRVSGFGWTRRVLAEDATGPNSFPYEWRKVDDEQGGEG